MRSIDINCDMGEGIGNDALIMPYIDAANIASTYHAGDESSMEQTVLLALKYGVKIGAHVSFSDRPNFGRTEMDLSAVETNNIIFDQLRMLKIITDNYSATLNHVKPHGALYNMSARELNIAGRVAASVKHFDPSLILYGLSGSHSISAAQQIGLKTASEVFADRTYQDDGSLTPRSDPRALINSIDQMLDHVKEIVEEETITALSGKKIKVKADTICIHGDGPHAVEFAKALYQLLHQ